MTLKKLYYGKNDQEVDIKAGFKADVTLTSDGEGGFFVGLRSDADPDPGPSGGQSMMAHVPRDRAVPAIQSLINEMREEGAAL